MSATEPAVTISGPKAPERQKFLPGIHCGLWRCQSRTLPSL